MALQTVVRRRFARLRGGVVAVVVAATALLAPVFVTSATAGEIENDRLVIVTQDGRFSILENRSQDAERGSAVFGDPSDQPLMGDWDCDGGATPGVYRTQTGQVFVSNSVTGGRTDASFYFGNPGDIALAGDFNKDGCDTIAVYRADTSVFYVRNSLTAGPADLSLVFGNPGDQPFVGDFDGDGRDTFGLYRQNGRAYLTNSFAASSLHTSFSFGNPGDQMFAGNWNGDARDSVAVYRPSNGWVYFRNDGSSLQVGLNQTAMGALVDATATSTNDSTTRPSSSPRIWDVDVELWPGDNLRSLVKAAPTGTVFRLNGTHSGQSIEPKDGQVFVGAAGAKLRGNGAEYAFRSDAVDVVIEGIEIFEYDSDQQRGAIQVEGHGWIVRENEIHHNAGVGVKVSRANRVTIDGNNIHHNEQLGIGVAYSSGSVVVDNEIAFNNWRDTYRWGWEAGGTKFWDTEGLIVRNNWSHDNHGPGLWDDYNNHNILYEGNLVEDNLANGIFHEIGYDAVIRNNTVRRNGFAHDAWLWGAGILIASSQNTEVYGNIVEGNYNGITITQQNRTAGPGYAEEYGPWIARNNSIYDNRITDSGITGAAQDIGSDAIYDANNTFSANHYIGATKWQWEGDRISWDAWMNFGQDRDGSYTP